MHCNQNVEIISNEQPRDLSTITCNSLMIFPINKLICLILLHLRDDQRSAYVHHLDVYPFINLLVQGSNNGPLCSE